jgi:hypothetical protein
MSLVSVSHDHVFFKRMIHVIVEQRFLPHSNPPILPYKVIQDHQIILSSKETIPDIIVSCQSFES